MATMPSRWSRRWSKAAKRTFGCSKEYGFGNILVSPATELFHSLGDEHGESVERGNALLAGSLQKRCGPWSVDKVVDPGQPF